MNTLKKLERTLKELGESPKIKLVEGKKDKKVLESFGVSNIKLIHSGSLVNLADRLREPEVILLTDFDRRGNMLAERLEELFNDNGTRIDLSYRNELRLLTGLNTFEELVSKHNELLHKFGDLRDPKKIKRRCLHGKNLHRYSKIRSLRKRGDRRVS